MKRNRKIKLLVATCGLMTASIAPITIIASCASVSQYFLPLTIGGVSTGPFSKIINALNSSGNKFLDDAGDFTFKSGSDNTKIATEPYGSYLPNNYITYTNRADKSTQAYGYSNPSDINKDIIAGPPAGHGHYPAYGNGWYNTADTKLTANKVLNDANRMLSYRNANIQSATYGTSYLGMEISSMINSMLHFISQPDILTDTTVGTKWLNFLFNGFDHGDKSSVQNKDFYEFLFGLNNLLSEGSSNVKFDVSAINFDYDSGLYGPGPFIGSSGEDGFYGQEGPVDVTQSSQADKNIYLMQNTFSSSDKALIEPIKNNCPWAYSYSSFSPVDTTTPQKIYGISSISSHDIPVVVNLTGTNDGVDFNYYNPTKNNGFLPTDYLTKDINEVKNKVEKTNAWNAMKNFTDKPKEDWAKTLRWSVKPQGEPQNAPQASFPILTPSNIQDAIRRDNGTTTPTPLEQCWYKMDTTGNLDNINSASFIAMANYSLWTETKPGVQSNTNGATIYDKFRVPLFNQFDSVFPVYLLYKIDNAGNYRIDGKMWSNKTAAIVDGIDDKSIKDSNKLWYLNQDEVNKKLKKIVTAINTKLKKGLIPDSLSQEDKYNYGIYKALFWHDTSISLDPLKSEDIIKPVY